MAVTAQVTDYSYLYRTPTDLHGAHPIYLIRKFGFVLFLMITRAPTGTPRGVCLAGGGGQVKNRELWERLDLARSRDVTFEWLRGHSGVEGNERADRLSQRGGQETSGHVIDSRRSICLRRCGAE
jgi:hypothetical protein